MWFVVLSETHYRLVYVIFVSGLLNLGKGWMLTFAGKDKYIHLMVAATYTICPEYTQHVLDLSENYFWGIR